MGACPFGAKPKAENAALQAFVDKAELPGAVASLLTRSAPLAWASLAAALVDYDELCASNPDPPAPFTDEDLRDAWVFGVPPIGRPSIQIIEKAWAWIRYMRFQNICECKGYEPPTSDINCIRPPGSMTVPAGGTLLIGAVTIDPAVSSRWHTSPNFDWEYYREGAAVVDGGAHTGSGINIEALNVEGGWSPIESVADLVAAPNFCDRQGLQAIVPKFSNNTQLRFRNTLAGAHTVTNFHWCFCALPGSIAPPPTQPDLPQVPNAPARTCTEADLCLMVSELLIRLERMATQLSDLEARVGGFDQLVEISRLTMVPEGEAVFVPGTRAVSVELTAIGSGAYTSALGNPRGLMRVGSIRYGDGIGYSPRKFIDADRFDDVRPPGATSISWQLLPGTEGILKFLG